MELDSQHELALNKVIQLRDETVAENVQLRARIVLLEEQQNNHLQTAETSLLSPTTTTPPPPLPPSSAIASISTDECKTLNHNDIPNQQTLSTVEFECLLHSNQRPEPDGQASENENVSFEDLQKQLQHLNVHNQELNNQLNDAQLRVDSIQADAQLRCNSLQVCFSFFSRSLISII